MREQLEKIKEEALRQIEASDALERLNDIRVAYLGKKGELTSVLKSMKDVSPEERPKVGQMVNEARALIEAKLEETKNVLARKAREEQMKREVIDVTLPAEKAMWDTAIRIPLRWRKWSAFLWAWDMRLWKARKWNMICITLKN